MKPFEAETNSGTTYSFDGVILTVTPRNGVPWSFVPVEVKALDRHAIVTGQPFLEQVENLSKGLVPAIGLSLFVAGLREWRLSTTIKSITFREAEETCSL